MAQLLARASALPHVAPVLSPSPFRLLRRHATERPDSAAWSEVSSDGTSPVRTWSEVLLGVERAAAGLLRRGLHPDQVVVCLAQAGPWSADIELAVRATGAVLVGIDPDADRPDVLRALEGVAVRLVIADDEDDLGRLAGVPLARAQVILLEEGAGWRLLEQHGAERLVMDPDAVTRLEAMVDPGDTRPRRIVGSRPGEPVVTLPPAPPELCETLTSQDVVLVAGAPRDAFLSQVLEAQLAAGAAVVHARTGTDLGAALAAVRPTVIALDAQSAAELEEQFCASLPDEPWAANLGRALEGLEVDGAEDPRVRRAFRLQARNVVQTRRWFGGRLERVLCPSPPALIARVARALRMDVPRVLVPGPLASCLPEVVATTRGDVGSLARRERSTPPRSFSLAVGDSMTPSPPAPCTPREPAVSAASAARRAWRAEGTITRLDELLERKATGCSR